MGDIVFSGLLLVVASVFSVAYLRRVRQLPISKRGHDTRASMYGALFYGAMLLWDVFKFAETILSKFAQR